MPVYRLRAYAALKSSPWQRTLGAHSLESTHQARQQRGSFRSPQHRPAAIAEQGRFSDQGCAPIAGSGGISTAVTMNCFVSSTLCVSGVVPSGACSVHSATSVRVRDSTSAPLV